jgi:NCS2 family nucleobase:cation symporter-2
MKNSNVILALLFGYFVAGVSNYEGLDYVNNDKIAAAPWFDFVWTEWFGLGFYGPALIPVLVAYIVTTVRCLAKDTRGSR